MSDLAQAFQTIGRTFEELERTVLAGWPAGQEWPTEAEAEQIEATYHELLMHEPDMGEDRAWVIAGNIVARFRRDGIAT